MSQAKAGGWWGCGAGGAVRGVQSGEPGKRGARLWGPLFQRIHSRSLSQEHECERVWWETRQRWKEKYKPGRARPSSSPDYILGIRLPLEGFKLIYTFYFGDAMDALLHCFLECVLKNPVLCFPRKPPESSKLRRWSGLHLCLENSSPWWRPQEILPQSMFNFV